MVTIYACSMVLFVLLKAMVRIMIISLTSILFGNFVRLRPMLKHFQLTSITPCEGAQLAI